MSDFLPWLNLLLLPIAYGVLSVNSRLARIEETQRHHGKRLQRLDGIEA